MAGNAPQQFEPCATGAKKIFPLDAKFDTNMSAAGSAGAATTLILSADAARPDMMFAVFYSYSAAPTGGALSITDGGSNTYFQIDITAAGPGQVIFPMPLAGPVNTALTITLAAPGGSVVGKLNLVAFKLT